MNPDTIVGAKSILLKKLDGYEISPDALSYLLNDVVVIDKEDAENLLESLENHGHHMRFKRTYTNLLNQLGKKNESAK